MLFSVARPIEEAVSIVSGVTRVHSRTIRGATEISITFSDNTDMTYALQQAQARVNQVRNSLAGGPPIEGGGKKPSPFSLFFFKPPGGGAGPPHHNPRHPLTHLLSPGPRVGW